MTQQPPDFFVVFKRSWTFAVYGVQLLLQLINVALGGRRSVTVRGEQEVMTSVLL